MFDYFAHFLLPRESNNYRAKLLHHQVLLIFIFAFILGGLFLNFGRSNYPSVLGISSDITVQQLLLDTNQKRLSNGLEPLTLNKRLDEAALSKATDMFSKNYWAHNAPDGTTPWVFIKNSGYDYTYAGENLARGFSSADDVVNAWMASPDHRKNLLSPNYKNIGFAIEEGKLEGEDTILVVQMFGNPTSQTAEVDTQEAAQAASNSSAKGIIKYPEGKMDNVMVAGAGASPTIDSKSFSKSLSLIVILGFVLIFMFDIILIGRKKVLRFVGHNIDHVLFLTMISIILFFLASGSII